MNTTATWEEIGSWIDRSRRGDREAFASLVRQYQGMVSGIALSRTGDLHRSEDLAQETFLLAWQKLAELDDIQKFPGWICSIARNLARNAVRKKSESEQTGTSPDVASEVADPAAAILAAEQNALIGAALQKIPENYREPLILFYRGEQSTQQIAAALEITEEAARQRLSRARKFLRKELERQVAGAIAASGPGEFFSLGVIAALPGVAILSASGKLAAATTLGTEPILAAAVCTPSQCGPGSACAATFSFKGFVLSVLSVFVLALFWFCWIGGLIPSLWLSVRNAPTLRARRFLILSSLRVHVLFGIVVFYCCLFPLVRTFLTMTFPGNWDYQFLETAFNFGFYTGLCVIGAVVLFFLVDAPIVYRRILREDAGLVLPKKTVPLEESRLSFMRLRKSYFRSAIALIVLLTVAWLSFYTWQELERIRLSPYTRFASTDIEKWNYWDSYIRFYLFFAVIGVSFLIMFREMHSKFLVSAKDKTSFAAAPTILGRNTPFRERIFVEWLVAFGMFLIAGFIFLLWESFMVGWIPRSPVSLFEAIGLLLAVTIGAATVNARFPILRWLVNVAVIGLLFASFVLFAYRRVDFLGWNHLPFQDFFDSPRSWPVLWGLIVLDAVLVFATLTAMVLGVVYLRGKGTGRFFSRRTVKTIFGVEIAVILVAGLFLYTPGRVPCLVDILVCRYRDDWTEHHNAKMLTLASEIIRSTSEKDEHYGWAHGTRGSMNIRERNYDAAVADYNIAICLCPREFFSGFYYDSRGEAKCAKGDAAGALEDFDKAIALGHTWNDIYYGRGVAHEKLGNIEAALADYDQAIAWAKRFAEPPPVVSAIPRTGYDEESRHRVYDGNRFGYVISFQELIEIRDNLRKNAAEQ